jgi:hypothetical protein
VSAVREGLVILGLWQASLWWWLVWVSAAGLVAWVALQGRPRGTRRQSRLLAALRGASVLAVAAGVVPALDGGPQLEVSVGAPWALVVDDSQSMSLPGRAPGRTRLAEAVDAARELARRLQAAGLPAPRLARLSRRVQLVGDLANLSATGTETDLASGLRDLAAQGQTGPVVLFSDGRDTVGTRAGTLGRLAIGHGLTVHAVAVGCPEAVRDVAVDGLSGARRVRAGAEFTLAGQVRLSGVKAAALELETLCNGRRVKRTHARAEGGVVRVSLRAGTAGRYRYTLRVPAVPGEVSVANNTASTTVEVIGGKPLVLLVAGSPTPEYARLKSLLLGDPDLRVRCYVGKGRGGAMWRDDAGQQAAAEVGCLGEADAVIALGPSPVVLRQFGGGLIRRVKGGAGLMVAPGPDGFSTRAMPGSLAAVLPIVPGVSPTGIEGQALTLMRDAGPVGRGLWAVGLEPGDLPSLGMLAAGTPKPGSEVALGAGGAPVLVAWQAGRGRVAALTTGQTHRWVFSAEANDRSERAYQQFWRTVVGWLTETGQRRPVTAEFDRDTYETGMPARLVVHVQDGAGRPQEGVAVAAHWSGPGGGAGAIRCEPISGTPGDYQALGVPQHTGRVAVRVTAQRGGQRLGAAEAAADVGAGPREFREPRPDPGVLAAVCGATGGMLLRADEVGLLPGPQLQRGLPTRGGPDPSPAPWALAAAVSLWGTDWWLRRRWWG